jgi:hypothetical protein
MIGRTATLAAAGEYYVLFRLLQKGFIAALAPRGVPHTDIIVSDDVGDKLSAIQVKTCSGSGGDMAWHMSKKHETIIHSTLFYCFVDVGDSPDSLPVCYIVPSKKVARVLIESHLHWYNTPGRKGQQRNQTEMRRFMPDYGYMGFKKYPAGWLDKFRENWGVLGSKS